MSNESTDNSGKEEPKGDKLLMEMTSVLNNLARFHDKNDFHGVKAMVDKGYELSLRGVKHAVLLDKYEEELQALKAENERLVVESAKRNGELRFTNHELVAENLKLKEERDAYRQELIWNNHQFAAKGMFKESKAIDALLSKYQKP